MKVKMILPALTEARSPYWRPIKYSLFPPLGLTLLAGYLSSDDVIDLQDEHVETLNLDDEPDLVVIEAYITSAYRAYELADHYRLRGAHVCLGGLHVTACPQEAARHADTIFCGPGEDTWPRFLEDFAHDHPAPCYQSIRRSLIGIPPLRRDLIKRAGYLVPNSIIVSRGCPHVCDFCYKESFFKGGKSFYTQQVDRVLEEIESLPGRHLFFLDDNLFADRRFAMSLFDGMRGMGRLWQAAGTVSAVQDSELLDCAVESGLRSLFIGFETLTRDNLRQQHKLQNIDRNYDEVVRRLHQRGVMINASFVFGMDADTPSVFDRTTEWAISQSIETATFHILTPYPGTRLHDRMQAEGRIITQDWSLYDTRHCVCKPAGMTPQQLEAGYRRAYETFYGWFNILRSAHLKPDVLSALRHLAYTGGWKKFEPFWGLIIKTGWVGKMRPLLEAILAGHRHRNRAAPAEGAARDIVTMSHEVDGGFSEPDLQPRGLAQNRLQP
jgi:radical SAM superfamily enzyme YgiQ (UPF0313 family)